MPAPKTALITGLTAQHGARLGEFLLSKGYRVHGAGRQCSTGNSQELDRLRQTSLFQNAGFTEHKADLSHEGNLVRLIQAIQPDEIYNFGAMSEVVVTGESPEYTADVEALGTLRLLEAVRILGWERKTRFYQGITSELCGVSPGLSAEQSLILCPANPYAAAKLYAYCIVSNYRRIHGMYACNGIHESLRQGEAQFTRTITRTLCHVAHGLAECLELGNLDSLRNWGHEHDYVRLQWLMLQQKKPDDFVLATGIQYSPRQFLQWSAWELGFSLRFEGCGVEEVGIVHEVWGADTPFIRPGQIVVRVDGRFFKPAQNDVCLGDPRKAWEELGWAPEVTIQQLCREMVQSDLAEVKSATQGGRHEFPSVSPGRALTAPLTHRP